MSIISGEFVRGKTIFMQFVASKCFLYANRGQPAEAGCGSNVAGCGDGIRGPESPIYDF